jgi:hypothetical protein
MNKQSKEDIGWIILCACIGGFLVINLLSDELPLRFVSIIISTFLVVVFSHNKWEEQK